MPINLTDAFNKLRQALNESQNRYTPAQTNTHVQRSVNTNNITNNSRLKSRPTSKVSATVNPVGTNVSRIRKLGNQTNYNNRSTNTHNAVVNHQNSTIQAQNNPAGRINQTVQNNDRNVNNRLVNRPTTADRVNAQRHLANPQNYQQEVNRQGILSGDEQLIMRGQLPNQLQVNNQQAQSEYNRLIGIAQDQVRRNQASRMREAQANDLIDRALQVLTPDFLSKYSTIKLENIQPTNELQARVRNNLELDSVENNSQLLNFVMSKFGVNDEDAKSLINIAVSNAREQFNDEQSQNRLENQKEINNPLDYASSLINNLSRGAQAGIQGINQGVNSLGLLNPFASELEQRENEARLQAMASTSENLSTSEYENMGGILGVGQNVSQAIGQMIPQMLVGGAFGQAAGMGTLLTGAAGQGTGQALRDGASGDEALMYGLTTGGIEALTEKITGGIPGLGYGGADAIANTLIGKFIGNRTGRNIAHYLYNMAGEGFEEWLSEYLGAFAKGIYDDETRDKDFWQVIEETTPDAINSFIIGGLTGGILNAYGTIQATRNGTDIVLTEQQEAALRKAQTDPDELTPYDVNNLVQADITGKFANAINGKNTTPEAQNIQRIINSEIRTYDDTHEYFDPNYQTGNAGLNNPVYETEITDLNNIRVAAQNQIVQDLYDELGVPFITVDSVQTMPNIQQLMHGETAIIDTGKNYDNIGDDLSRVQDVDNLVIQSNSEADLLTVIDYFENNYNANILYARDSYGQPAIIVEFNTIDLDGSVPSTPAHIIIVPSYSKFAFNNSLINRVDELESKERLTKEETQEVANKKFDLQLVNRNNYYTKTWQDIQNYAGTTNGDVRSLEDFLFSNGTLQDHTLQTIDQEMDLLDDYEEPINVAERTAQQEYIQQRDNAISEDIENARENSSSPTAFPNTRSRVNGASNVSESFLSQAMNRAGMRDDMVGIDPESDRQIELFLDDVIDDYDPDLETVGYLDENGRYINDVDESSGAVSPDEVIMNDSRMGGMETDELTPLAQSIANAKSNSYSDVRKAIAEFFNIPNDGTFKSALDRAITDIRNRGNISSGTLENIAKTIHSQNPSISEESIRMQLEGSVIAMTRRFTPVAREMNLIEYGRQMRSPSHDIGVDVENAIPSGRVSRAVNTVVNDPQYSQELREQISNDATRKYFTNVPRSRAKQLLNAAEYIDEYGVNRVYRQVVMDDPEHTSFGNLAMASAVAKTLSHQLEKMGRTDEAVNVVRKNIDYGSQAGWDLNIRNEINDIFKNKRTRGEAYYQYVKQTVDELNSRKAKPTDPDIVITAEEEAQLKKGTNVDNALKSVSKKVLDRYPGAPTSTKLDTLRYAAMLWNPRTWIRNSLGNTVNMAFNSIADQVDAVLQNTIGRSLENRARRLGKSYNRTQVFKTDPAYKQLAKDVLPGGNQQARVNIDSGVKYQDINNRVFKHDVTRKVFNFLNAPSDFMLNTGDKIFFNRSFRKNFARYLQANNVDVNFARKWLLDDNYSISDIRNEAKQFSTDSSQQEAYIKQRFDTIDLINDAVEHSNQEALKSVYRQNNDIANAVNSLRGGSMDSRIMYRIANAVFPFLRTPLNILNQSFENSPLGLAQSLREVYRSYRYGDVPGTQALNHLAHNITGTGLVLLGYYLTKSGLLTGSGGDMTEEEKKVMEDVYGWQPYAIHWRDEQGRDHYYDMSWLNPTSIDIALGSAIADSDQSSMTDAIADGDWFKGMEVLGSAVLTPITDMSMLNSLEYIAPYNSDGLGDAMSQLAINILQNYFLSYVPSIVGNINETFVDPVVRTTAGSEGGDTGYFINRIKQRIPNQSKTLQPKLNSQGEQMYHGETWNRNWGLEDTNVLGRIMENFVSPGDHTMSTANSTTDELMRLTGQTGETGILPDTSMERKITYDGKDYELTNEQFTQYNQELRSERDQMIQELQNTEIYQNMTDQERLDMIDDYDDYLNEKLKNEYLRSQGVKVTDSSTVRKAEEAEKLGMSMAEYFLIKHNAGTSQSDIMTYMLNSGYTADEVNDYIFKVEKEGVWTPDDEYKIQVEMYNNPDSYWNYDTVHSMTNQYVNEIEQLTRSRGGDDEAVSKAEYNLEETIRDYVACQYAASRGYDYSDTNAGRLYRAQQSGMGIPEFVLINSNSSYVDRVAYMLDNGYNWNQINYLLDYVYEHQLSENDITKLQQMGYSLQ